LKHSTTFFQRNGEEYETASGRKKELLLTYTPEHEKVKVIDSKIKDLTDYQTESIKNTQKNLQIKYNDIDRDIQIAEQAFIGLPEKKNC
jgi:hypothetical protein